MYPDPGLEALEHGRVLEHVGYDHEPDPAPPDEDVLQLRHLAVLPARRGKPHQIKSNLTGGGGVEQTAEEGSERRRGGKERGYLGGEGDVLDLAVPVVLALDHGAPVDLAGLELDRDHVPRRLVQQLHRDPQAAAHLRWLADAEGKKP